MVKALIQKIVNQNISLLLTAANILVNLYWENFKVLLTQKYFCTSLPLPIPNLDFLHSVKVTKPDHHLLHDRASKGCGSIPGLTSQTSLHACL